MTRLEKIQLALDKGFIYDPETGNVYGVTGKVLKGKRNGYMVIGLVHNKKIYMLSAHQFAFFVVHHKIIECIDHINGDKLDNRIVNLREVTRQENHFNRTTVKGYSYHKAKNKYQARIMLNGKHIFLGYFETPEEARACYLENKKKYHKINQYK